MRLSVLLASSRRDYTPRLSFPVGEVATVIDNNVASLTSGLGSDNSFGGDNLSHERRFIFVNVDRDGGLVIVWLRLEEVFSSNFGAKGLKKTQKH
jgi:hypothetical protein